MARRPRRQYRRRKGGRGFRRGFRSYPVFGATVSVASLANLDAVSAQASGTFTTNKFLISSDFAWNTQDKTDNVGPIICGLAHGDYTAAEIEEWIEATASTDDADMIANERRKRKIRWVGTFPGEITEEALNDGMPIHTKLGWVQQEETSLSLWAYNLGGVTITAGNVLATGILHTRQA